jgi:branched-chain amino acid transport system substrate-binding protein
MPVRLQKKTVGTVAVISALLAVSACGGAATGGGSGGGGDVSVGLLISQTGVYSPIGQEMQRAVDLYMGQHNSQLGGRAAEIVVADDAGNPETGKQKAKELVQRQNVDVITGIVSSPVGAAVATEAQTSKVPVVIANAGANDITAGEVSNYVWRAAFSTHQLGYSAGVYAAEHLAKDGAVLMGADYAGGTEVLKGFVDGYRASGGAEPKAQILTPFGQTQNFQPHLAKIPADAKFVYAFYAGGEAVTFVKNWDQFGYKKKFPLLGAQNLTDEDVLPAIGDAAIDVLTVGLYSPAINSRANEEFVARWREKYNALPSIIAVQTWDAMQLIDQAVGKVEGDVTGESLAKALGRSGMIVSPRGEFTLDPTSHNPMQAFYARRLEKKDGAYVNTVVATIPAASVAAQPSS